jgi:hypothetical protein
MTTGVALEGAPFFAFFLSAKGGDFAFSPVITSSPIEDGGCL